MGAEQKVAKRLVDKLRRALKPVEKKIKAKRAELRLAEKEFAKKCATKLGRFVRKQGVLKEKKAKLRKKNAYKNARERVSKLKDKIQHAQSAAKGNDHALKAAEDRVRRTSKEY